MTTDKNQGVLRIARSLLENRHLLVLMVVLVAVAGSSAYRSLPRQEDPVITNRNPQIITLFPGASAERVEALVTEPIERELKEIPEIKHLDTTSRAGVSVVAVELQDAISKKTNKAIFSEIRDALADATATFPEGVQTPRFDDKRNAVAFTLITALRWEDGREESLGILARQAEELADRLRAIPGTELVRLYGLPEEELGVTVDPDELVALGLTVADLSRALQQADAKVPSGVLHGAGSDLLLEVRGELDSAERIRNVPLRQTAEGRSVRIGDVATVERGVREPASTVGLADGRRAVFVAARVQEGRRVDAWAPRAKEALATFTAEIGGGITVETIFDQNSYTSARLGELGLNLLLGAAVVFLVVLVTMGWRSAAIVGSALPLTAAITLFVVALQGGALHQMSIFGMIIALGLLIDNAIVVTDEIGKHLRAGLDGVRAVSATLRHLFIPLLSSTLTTILAFLPILLLPGGAGDFVGSIGGSVVIALAASFLVGMTLIPAFAGLFGRSRRIDERLPQWLRSGIGGGTVARSARSLLGWSVRRPVLAILLAASVPVAGFALARTLGSQFFPRTDRNMFEVEVWMPTETSVARTRAVAEGIEELVRTDPSIGHVHWLVGASFPPVYYNLIENQDGSPHYAHAIVEAESAEDVRLMIDQLQVDIDRRFPEAQVLVSKFAQGPPAPADVEIRLLGPGIETLQALGDEVRLVLTEHPGILQTKVTMPRGEPKLWVDADEDEARRAGLALTDLAAQLQTRLSGATGGTVVEDVEELPVRIRYPESSRNEIGEIANLNYVSPAAPGRWVPLTALGELTLRPELGGITRRDGTRTNTILGFARSDALPIDIARDVMDTLEANGFALPAGYRLELGGETENQAEAVGNLMLYLPVLVVLTVAILILSFRSVRIAGILLLVAPLSVGFGLLATWAMQLPLSFNTILGSLGLMGLAFNSSIVVLAAIRADEAARAGDPDAIVHQVLGSGRHLLSTTLTTMGSFLPLLLFIGGEFWPPLAIVLAGGVGGSTLLALFLTPAAYRLLLCPKCRRSKRSEPVDLPAVLRGIAAS